jgi:hypothetical protein
MVLDFSKLDRGIVRLPNTDSSKIEAFSDLDIPTSDQLTGIELRMSKVFIKDNDTWDAYPFFKYADLYFLVITIDDLGGEPYSVSIKGFSDVDDNEQLPVDRTIYYWKSDASNKKSPGQIHTLATIIKSNEGIRDFGNALSELTKTDDYKDVIKTIISTVSGGVTAIPDVIIKLAGIIGKIMGNVKDKPLITTVLSFTDINGFFDVLGRHKYNSTNRHVDLEFTLIIRDKSREPG